MKTVKDQIHYWCNDTINRVVLGQNITVAVLDTGISRHPDFGKRIIAFKDIIKDRKIPYDDSGHGTHVCGILAGNGSLSGGTFGGMAPRSKLVIVKVLDENGDGSIDEVVKGIQWVLDNQKKYQIRIVNISVGTKPDVPKKNSEKLIEMTQRLWDAGMVVVASAGNYGPKENSISIPGTCKKIITVGALGKEEELVSSSRGPTQECVIKPDILAPGEKIMSCQGKWYAQKSGTSMSTPIVSGGIALLLSKYPEMTNVEVKLLLRHTMDSNRRIHIERLLNTSL
ncbi:MAG: S8 family peptidase [Hespellia sp.]|nr:S8 family peptidase [Hespellia sp.]